MWAPLRLKSNPLQWRHNDRDGVSNHQPSDCLLSPFIRHRLKKASTPRVTGLCEGNSPVTGEFPTQMASNVENVSIWWRHHKQRKHKGYGLLALWWIIHWRHKKGSVMWEAFSGHYAVRLNLRLCLDDMRQYKEKLENRPGLMIWKWECIS